MNDSRIHENVNHSDPDKEKQRLRTAEEERGQLINIITSLQAKLDLVMQNVSDIVYMLDSNGLITSINRGVERIGFSPRELIGVNIFEIVHPLDREKAVYHVNERRTGERSTRSYAVRFITKDLQAPGDPSNYEKSPLLTISAEGHYAIESGDKMSFAGTLGIARELSEIEAAACSCDTADSSLIPVCASCKNFRDADGNWIRMESYLHRHCGMRFTHSICPSCTSKLYPELDIERLKKR